MRCSLVGLTRVVAGICSATTIAAATVQPAVATDLESLRARAQAIAQKVGGLERSRQTLTERAAAFDRRIALTSRNIGVLELAISQARQRYEAALEVFVQRAIETYKSGGSSAQLALLLSADDVSDLMLLAKASSEIARDDAAALAELQAAQSAAEATQAALDDRKQRLIAARDRQAQIAERVGATIEQRRAVLARLSSEIKRLEHEARRQAALAPQPDAAFARLLAPSGPSSAIPEGFVGTGVTIEGMASWYGPGFEGNPTASGDIFNPDLYTAASKELPLGTWLYVEHEGKGVVVLVNDRGPYIDGRILDLSRAAAFAIGITGLGWIEAEVIVKR